MANFCSTCGTAANPGAAFCASCGGALAAVAPTAPMQPMAPQQPYGGYVRQGKSKTTAVVLAVFLGYWSWLYTFQRDKAKFFSVLGASVVMMIINISIFAEASRQSSYYVACFDDAYVNGTDFSACEMYSPNFTGVYLTGLIGFGLWVWTLVDQSRKSQAYYTNFPNQSV